MGYYLGLPRWAYEITERKAEEKVRGDVITKAGSEGCSVRRTQPDIAGVEDGGKRWGDEPRKAGGLWKLKKARKWSLPWSFQKGTQAC